MHDVARTANLLGAAAVAFGDLVLASATEASGASASGAAALVTLSAAPDISVTELGRRVGLTQSASARMVDSLEADGLVERRAHAFNKRWVTVHPTRSGRAAARRLLALRERRLAAAVSTLDEVDQRALAEVLGKLLTQVYADVGDSQYLCRLCDRECCGASEPCPVGEAERNNDTHHR
ncbi:MAG TPA: MarR family transcriptional regulator [Stackebrandtia sp.]|jgi:DNA-binding MarR family transcriptional regulator|uniref:MarR family winged helix-turn-helix transcriptional regulator n=1 Tax=Stackebrandtia sp. TaxID=2023065 RepID=UPI002D28DF01|nr:MarR family transcriptional regulator [Stackebrandtia sp.]HZE40089.1 MarR family transcriptional regulator [Stackebrandtia sp.]